MFNGTKLSTLFSSLNTIFVVYCNFLFFLQNALIFADRNV